MGPDIKSKPIPTYSQNSLFFKTCSLLFEGFLTAKTKELEKNQFTSLWTIFWHRFQGIVRKFQVADAWADVEETWRSIRLRPAQFVDFLTQVPLDGWTVGRFVDVSGCDSAGIWEESFFLH